MDFLVRHSMHYRDTENVKMTLNNSIKEFKLCTRTPSHIYASIQIAHAGIKICNGQGINLFSINNVLLPC